MGCDPVDLGNGTRAIVCARGRKRKCVTCGRTLGKRDAFQCDGPKPTRKSGTCDALLCSKCAIEVGRDRHLCGDCAKPGTDARRNRCPDCENGIIEDEGDDGRRVCRCVTCAGTGWLGEEEDDRREGGDAEKERAPRQP